MEDPSTLRKEILEAYEASKGYEDRKAYEYKKAYEDRRAAAELQEAKLKALQDTIGNYGDYKYVDLEDFIDPDNQNWNDYTYKVFSPLVGIKGRVSAASPIGVFIKQIRDAKNTDDVKKQLEVWNSYKPLDLSHNGESYVNHIIYGLNNAPYGGSRPVFPTTDEPNPVQTTAGGTQGGVAVGGAQGTQTGGTGGIPSTQGVQGAQAGAKPGNAVAGGGVQGSNNGSGGAQGAQAGNGTYASSGVAKGGTKTIGYDPNPGNVSLAYAMRNAPEQERRNALIDKWNRENGRSGGNTYASAGIPRGGVVSTATMMKTSGVQPVQAAYGNNAPMGEGFDYTRTYDPMSNSMRPNDSYSYYDPSRNAPSGGDGTDLTLTYDPMTGQMVRRRR